MTTPAGRFLNSEKGGTTESKKQKDGKSKWSVARLSEADCNVLPIRAPSVPVGHF